MTFNFRSKRKSLLSTKIGILILIKFDIMLEVVRHDTLGGVSEIQIHILYIMICIIYDYQM